MHPFIGPNGSPSPQNTTCLVETPDTTCPACTDCVQSPASSDAPQRVPALAPTPSMVSRCAGTQETASTASNRIGPIPIVPHRHDSTKTPSLASPNAPPVPPMVSDPHHASKCVPVPDTALDASIRVPSTPIMPDRHEDTATPPRVSPTRPWHRQRCWIPITRPRTPPVRTPCLHWAPTL